MLVLYAVNHIGQQKSCNNIRHNTGNVTNCVTLRENIRHALAHKVRFENQSPNGIRNTKNIGPICWKKLLIQLSRNGYCE